MEDEETASENTMWNLFENNSAKDELTSVSASTLFWVFTFLLFWYLLDAEFFAYPVLSGSHLPFWGNPS